MAINGRTQSDPRVHAKGGKVIVVVDFCDLIDQIFGTASREVEIDLDPTQALMFAQLLVKHAGRASRQEQL